MWPFRRTSLQQGSPFPTPQTQSQTPISGVNLDVSELIALRHQVGALSIGKQKRALSMLAGTSISPFKGRGIDFEEVRRYQPGDEIRHMDWRVTARSGQPHLKLFREERERPVFFVMDFSSTMLFGTKVAFKSVIAARVGSLLAWASLKHGDRVGALIFSDFGHDELRPRGGRSAVLHFIRSLADMHAKALLSQPANPATGQRPMSQALRRLLWTAKPGSLIFLISDFRSLDDSSLSILTRLRDHQELMALKIFDPLEASPPPSGRYRISNGTQFETIDTSLPSVVSRYRQTFDLHHAHVETTCRRLEIGLLPIATNDSLARVLQSGLQARGLRRGHQNFAKPKVV